MASKRMFSIHVIDTDLFMDMPMSSQLLYFHLALRSDDDGFVGSPKKIKNMIGASDDDLKLLIAKQYVIPFDDGALVIKHWRVHNTIRMDRYTPTVYTEDKDLLDVTESGAYEIRSDLAPIGCHRENRENRIESKANNEEQLKADFEKIYAIYPKKEGKANAFRTYKAWVTTGRKVCGSNTRLSNFLIYRAVKRYVDKQKEAGTEMQFYKQFSTLMNNITDYLEESDYEDDRNRKSNSGVVAD